MSSSSSSSRSYRIIYTKEEILRMTHCKCEIPIYQQVAWTPTNQGRRFKGFPTYDADKKCGVYDFIDDELPSKYYKELFYKLHMENKELRTISLSKFDQGPLTGSENVVALVWLPPLTDVCLKPKDVVALVWILPL
ncbi:hypothetical protein Tco_1509901 [Tanacetum coccineum]